MLLGTRIVLVEDDAVMGGSLVQRLELEGASVQWFKRAGRALGALRTPAAPIDAVVCDIRLPDGDGETLFETLCRTASPPPFLFITGHGGIEQAVRLLHAGAVDYVTKPFELPVFLERLCMLVHDGADATRGPFLGVSAAARKVERMTERAAEVDTPVLIRGGPGLGKALVAQRIHALSDRRAAPFVSVNLAREADIERALFGPDGALARTGEGVLFVQSLRHLPGGAQERLLFELDTGFEGRVIGACGFDLHLISDQHGFNTDLYYRLSVTEITVPPLASRPGDAVWLMHIFFKSSNARRAVPLGGISRLAEEAVRAHDWPGGGRELRSRIRRGVEAATGELLQPGDLFPERLGANAPFLTLAQAREQTERRQIIEALERSEGQVGQAAILLGVSRTTLWEKMHRLGLAGAGH